MSRETLEIPEFVGATVRRTLALGATAALGLGLVVTRRFGLSVAASAALAAANFAAIAEIGRRMFDQNAGRGDDQQSPWLWTGLLVAKMILLLVAAAGLVLYAGVHPIGVAVGYTLFVAAAVWSALETGP